MHTRFLSEKCGQPDFFCCMFIYMSMSEKRPARPAPEQSAPALAA